MPTDIALSSIEADIAIVGAGVAGLFCAWQLLQADPTRRIVVFDRLNRTGGRLDTDLIQLKDSSGKTVEVKDEEGGMRFNTSMQELFTVLGRLGLCNQIVPFKMGDSNNRYFIRGKSFTSAESKANDNAIWSELYHLEPAERNRNPVEIITTVYHQLLSENGVAPPANPTPKFWQRFRLEFKHQGIPLNEWGLWALMNAFGYSRECIAMMADTIGFAGPFYSQVSAGEAYQILEDFPADPTFYTLEKGFSMLPNTLAERIEQQGGQILLQSLVTRISRDGGGKFVLDLQPAVENRVLPLAAHASQVILALPAEALNTLYASSPVLHGEGDPTRLLSNIHSSIGMRLCKINLYFEQAWWRDGSTGQPPVSDGGSFTSLPVGAAYVFDPLQGESATGPAAVTIYCDFNNTTFWESLQAIGPKFDSPLQREHNRQRPQLMFPASQKIVDEALQQFQLLFKADNIASPVLTSYRLWSGEQQFGHAYHQWARFADDAKVKPEIANPVPHLFICNEAYSDDQGWVNGSLRSAEIVLTEHFGIAPLVLDPAQWKMPCTLPAHAQQRRPMGLFGAR
jgi:monoamine oxidase